MNPAKTEMIFSLYERGLLWAAEVAYSLLYDLLWEQDIETSLRELIESLPEEVRLEFFRLLREIQAADYQWTPLLFSAPKVPMDSAERAERLRRICALLGLEQGPGKQGEENPATS